RVLSLRGVRAVISRALPGRRPCMPLTKATATLIVVASSLVSSAVLAASAPEIFTAAQAAAGKAAYESTCIACHTASLIPAPDAKMQTGQKIPPLAGDLFLAKWGPESAGALAKRISVAMSGFPPKGMTE